MNLSSCKWAVLAALWLFSTTALFAQLGGRDGFSFLGVAPTARAAALGGLLPQNGQADAASFLYNPAGKSTPGIAALSYNPYAGRFRYSTASAMVDALDGTAGIGIQYLDYGTLSGYTPGGISTGTFSANAYVVNLNYSRSLGPFRYGLTLKLAGSSIEAYTATGAGADLGLSYSKDKTGFSAGIALQNIGGTFKTFQGSSGRKWPLSLQAGVAYKFAHMPLRFYATAQQLQKWDIVYLDPGYNVNVDASGNETPEKKPWSEKLFRHAAVGAELLVGKGIVVRGGYNHLARKEMRIVNSSSGAAGYSAGIGLHVRRFTFDYTHMFIGPAGGANYMSLGYAFGHTDTSVIPSL